MKINSFLAILFLSIGALADDVPPKGPPITKTLTSTTTSTSTYTSTVSVTASLSYPHGPSNTTIPGYATSTKPSDAYQPSNTQGTSPKETIPLNPVNGAECLGGNIAFIGAIWVLAIIGLW